MTDELDGTVVLPVKSLTNLHVEYILDITESEY